MPDNQALGIDVSGYQTNVDWSIFNLKRVAELSALRTTR
jgi:GH25 family lysozyme M1 (1,4-beta-N-acetylmuramidase)